MVQNCNYPNPSFGSRRSEYEHSEMNPGLTAEAAQQLQEGISSVISRWAALRMAVENEWGGRDSLQKSQQLGHHLFRRLTNPKVSFV
ncbi:UNVERIFIED_CONTAM: hypothetical protein Sangu_1386600 [Sesamum angustifolium]|uniref:Uncharacterized protein n=1 Tax=Sesamum angustifolium TaxID=2727405 RepID=A0AAW2N580_9LAMI